MPSTIGSGLGAVLRVGIEPSYGVAAPSFVWVPIQDFKATLQPNFQQGSALKYAQYNYASNTVGGMVHSQYERVWSSADASGTFSTYFHIMSLNRLYAGICGGNMATLAPGTYDGEPNWAFPLASAYGSSLELIAYVPNTTGALDAWTLSGVKITEMTLTAEVGSLPVITWSVDAKDRTLAIGGNPGTAAYATSNQVYGFPNMRVWFNSDLSQEIDGIEKLTLTVKRGYQNARYTALSTNRSANGPAYAVKEEPIENGFFDISGTLDTEFISTASFVDVFMAQSTFPLYPQWNGPVIPGSSPANDYTIRISMPSCRYTGGDPTIDGPDIVKPSLPFIVLNDEVDVPFTIGNLTSEATL